MTLGYALLLAAGLAAILCACAALFGLADRRPLDVGEIQALVRDRAGVEPVAAVVLRDARSGLARTGDGGLYLALVLGRATVLRDLAGSIARVRRVAEQQLRVEFHDLGLPARELAFDTGDEARRWEADLRNLETSR